MASLDNGIVLIPLSVFVGAKYSPPLFPSYTIWWDIVTVLLSKSNDFFVSPHNSPARSPVSCKSITMPTCLLYTRLDFMNLIRFWYCSSFNISFSFESHLTTVFNLKTNGFLGIIFSSNISWNAGLAKDMTSLIVV